MVITNFYVTYQVLFFCKRLKYNASVEYFCRNLLSFIANRDITKKLSLRYDDDN